MKLLLLAVSVVGLGGNMFAADLAGVKSVYFMPMSNGLDQYLALRLSAGQVIQVVADPQKADAVFTDHLGQNFEEKLEEMYGEKRKSDDTSPNEQKFSRVGSGAHPRGAAFLVSRKTREVVWSAYARPRNTTPQGLRSAADRIGDALEKAMKGEPAK